ncbi:MAG: FAD-dependent oxidoreductase [Bacillota bacterium]
MPRYVIIGNSAAGITAAEAIRRVSPGAAVTIVDQEPHHVYSRCLIPEVVAGMVGQQDIYFRPADFYHRMNLEPLLGKRVDRIEAAGRRLCLEGGTEIPYDALLVATGARPARADVPGENLKGVFTLRTWDDARAIAEMAADAEEAVVIGGGLVSLKAAVSLKKRGVRRVTVVVKSRHILSRQLDRQGAVLVQEALEALGIQFLFRLNPREFTERAGTSRKKSKVRAVILEDGREIQADLVVVGKGVIPNAELIREAGGKVRRGVVVDGHQRTDLPAIYAAGDVTEATDVLTGETVQSALWTLAVEQGRVAGLNMAGERCRYEGSLTRLNAAELGGVAFVSVGLVEGEGLGWKQGVCFDREKGSYRRLVFREGRLVGAILVGDISRAGIYTALIRRGQQVTGYEEDLLRGEISAYRFLGVVHSQTGTGAPNQAIGDFSRG